jgi:hypothetical protein
MGSNTDATISANEKNDSYFGVCPNCGRTDGYINVGRGHWFFCKEHKVTWLAGTNLFSAWRDETEDHQRKIFDELDFGSFETVEPVYAAVGEERAEYDKIKALALVDEAAVGLSHLRQLIESLPVALSKADGTDLDAFDCARRSDDLAKGLARISVALGFRSSDDTPF